MGKSYKVALNVPWAGKDYENYYANELGSLNKLIRSEPEAYAKVPLIFRAIKLRCNGLTRIPVYIYDESDTLLDQYQFEDSLSLRNLLWLSEAAMLLKGASYVLKRSNAYGYNKGLQWLNPFTIETKFIDGELQLWQQMANGGRFPKEKDHWTIDEFLYFKDFNPSDDIGPGVSATQVALRDSQILGSVSKFLSDFFASDALPITMVVLPEGTMEGERNRVEDWFKKKLSKLRQAATRVLGVSADIKVERLTAELKTFDFDKVDTHAVQGISDAFDIPQSLLRSTSGANRAISDNERRSFLEDTLIPRAKYHESIINPFLKEFGQRIEFAPEEMPEMQEDEVTRAQSLNQLVTSGVPVIAALDILGYDISDSSMRIIRKSERRKINQAEKLLNAPPKDPNAQPVDGDAQAVDENDPTVKAELDKWFRKALKKLKAGKSADVDFESDTISEETIETISKALKIVSNEEELRKIFEGGNHG